MRIAFVEELAKLAAKDKDLWLVNGDLGFSVLENFIGRFPKQYLNVGVSEQNMIGVAAGLALLGKTVFAYSIVPFITLRCLEQIRNDVCIQNLNVKLVGVGSGFSNSLMGPTHHSIEDIGIMRALPNMTVVCPGDPWEVKNATEQAYKMHGPVYLRIGKKEGDTDVKKNYKFKIGNGIIISEGERVAIISTGNMLQESLKVVRLLADSKLSARLISMHTVKPIDVDLIKECGERFEYIFTIEEHSIIGGLGSAVSEAAMQNKLNVNLHSFAVADKFTKIAGSQDYLRKVNGLSCRQIAHKILTLIN